MSLLSTLKSVTPYHMLLYSVLFGSTAYQSFFAGIVAFKTLPYEQFSALQAKIFPPYFNFQAVASTLLLLSPPVKFVGTAAILARGSLGTAAVGSLANIFWLSPLTRDIMARRRAQEAKEGKSCKDKDVSEDMKLVNKEFGKVHGYSVLANMGTFLGLLTYGVVLSDGFRRLVRVVPK